MNPKPVFSEVQASLAGFYQQQLEAALSLYASLGALRINQVLPESLRVQTEVRQRGAAILVADTLREWREFGGSIELSPSVETLISLLASREGSVSTVSPEVVRVPPLAEEAVSIERPPTPVIVEPARIVAGKCEETSPFERRVIVTEGTRWKTECRLRLSSLKQGETRVFIEVVRDWIFLDSLPAAICHSLLEYIVASTRRLKHGHVQMDVICEIARYIKRHRILEFVYGIATSHAKNTQDGEWVRRIEESLAFLEGDLSEMPPKLLNRERLLHDLEMMLVAPKTSSKDIADLVEQILASGVAANHTRLVRLLLPHLDTLADRRSLKGVRKAAHRMIEAEESAEVAVETTTEVISPDWPWLEYTMGHRAVIFGGKPRPEHADLVRDTFGFESVDWVDAEHSPRAYDPVIQRIRSGTYDFVFILTRFTSHRSEDLINEAKARHVSAVRVHHGYGLARLRRAIEESLAALSAHSA